ncbi:MAG TPA: chromosome segregation protein SMC, partial [Nitrospira sp.]|nr:chromosome segregation protein SMC [Nitrospira sp.]
RFLPERYGVSSCRFGKSKILAPNGANLPEVLNLLQANRPMFQDYNALVHRIFPSIYEVSIRPSEMNADSLEILVRTDQPDSRRMDL